MRQVLGQAGKSVHRSGSRSGSRSRLVGPGARQGCGCDAAGVVAQAGPRISLKVASRGMGSALAETSLQRRLTASPQCQQEKGAASHTSPGISAPPSACTLNASGMGNKQEELEVCGQLQGYNLVWIMKTWWDSSHDWMLWMQWMDVGFGMERPGWQGRGVALYVREQQE